MKKQMKFFPDQIALAPTNNVRAMTLLQKMGMTEWHHDRVVANGTVFGNIARNQAELSFNYQALEGHTRELEVLQYIHGDNWLNGPGGAEVERIGSVSHFGMHVTEEELRDWRAFFAGEGIGIAQEVETQSHTNPAIAGKRRYKYVIFNTRPILGVDVKFIVRIVTEQGVDIPTPSRRKICRGCGHPIDKCVCDTHE